MHKIYFTVNSYHPEKGKERHREGKERPGVTFIIYCSSCRLTAAWTWRYWKEASGSMKVNIKIHELRGNWVSNINYKNFYNLWTSYVLKSCLCRGDACLNLCIYSLRKHCPCNILLLQASRGDASEWLFMILTVIVF